MADPVLGPPSLPPNTTEQEDMVVAGQRKINLIWEYTQATVTIMIVGALVYCEIKAIDAPTLKVLAATIVSTYYARTNHTKTGGVGPKSGEAR